MKRSRQLVCFSALAIWGNVVVWTTVAGCGPDNTNVDGGDASLDNTQPDVKADTSTDVANDITDAGSSDAPPDVTAIIQFQQQYAAALCNAYGTYCYKAQLDSGLPDANLAYCEGVMTGPGGGGPENVIGDLADPNALNSGHIVLNTPANTSCLAGVATMTLPMIPGSEYATLALNCVGALSGTQPVGQSCHKTIECANGFCQPTADAGNVCAALSGLNGNCNSLNGSGNDQCMYRGWMGTTQLRCDNTEQDGGPGTNKCTAKLANGSGCWWEWDCQTNTCDDAFLCATGGTAWTMGVGISGGWCKAYFGPDSGLN